MGVSRLIFDKDKDGWICPSNGGYVIKKDNTHTDLILKNNCRNCGSNELKGCNCAHCGTKRL